jgi:hypothetical protein
MHSNTGTGPQQPGKSSQEGSGGGKDPGAVVTGGPSSVMGFSSGSTNKDYAGTQTAGCSAQKKSGGDGKWAEGGTTAMFGNRGSTPAKGGCSAP